MAVYFARDSAWEVRHLRSARVVVKQHRLVFPIGVLCLELKPCSITAGAAALNCCRKFEYK